MGTKVNKRHVAWYLDDVLQTGIKQRRIYNVSTAGGNGIASKFLTSDGLTKTGGNTFLFTTILNAGGNDNAVQADSEAPTNCGFAYNGATGLLEVKFMESQTSSIGVLGGTAEGLADEEDGTTVVIWVEGIV